MNDILLVLTKPLHSNVTVMTVENSKGQQMPPIPLPPPSAQRVATYFGQQTHYWHRLSHAQVVAVQTTKAALLEMLKRLKSDDF